MRRHPTQSKFVNDDVNKNKYYDLQIYKYLIGKLKQPHSIKLIQDLSILTNSVPLHQAQ